jgi:hypothetical protein
VFVTIGLLAALGVVVSFVISLFAMKFLGGGVLETLVFFGLAERPVKVPPRRVPVVTPLALDEPLITMADLRGTADAAA